MTDDFTPIKDIGPRFAQALCDAGITRFAQLAALTRNPIRPACTVCHRARSAFAAETDRPGTAACGIRRAITMATVIPSGITLHQSANELVIQWSDGRTPLPSRPVAHGVPVRGVPRRTRQHGTAGRSREPA